MRRTALAAASFGRFHPRRRPGASPAAPRRSHPSAAAAASARARRLRPTASCGRPTRAPTNGPRRRATAHGRAACRAIGDGGYDLGARAQQIRDRLKATPTFDEKSLGAIQFDDEALFLRPWAGRIAAVAASPTARPEITRLLKPTGTAAPTPTRPATGSSREVRKRTLDALWAAWSQPLAGAGQCPDARDTTGTPASNTPPSRCSTSSRAHLLPRGFASWDAFLLAQVDATVADMTRNGARPLAQATWGEANRSHIGHVLSRAVPALSHVAGHAVACRSRATATCRTWRRRRSGSRSAWSSRRGTRSARTLSMPGGQSGHPMSPYYGAGHADWVAGRATPLLAGAAQHVLTLTP